MKSFVIFLSHLGDSWHKWRAECSFRKGLDNLGHRVESSQHFFFPTPSTHVGWGVLLLITGTRYVSDSQPGGEVPQDSRGSQNLCPYWTNPSSVWYKLSPSIENCISFLLMIYKCVLSRSRTTCMMTMAIVNLSFDIPEHHNILKNEL